MEKLKQFLEAVSVPDTVMQIGEFNTVEYVGGVPSEEILKRLTGLEKNLYFLSGIRSDVTKRADDSEMAARNYMGFDFDLAKDKGWTVQEIKDSMKAATDWLLGTEGNLNRLLAVIFSGGGAHFYYRTPIVRDFANWRGVYQYVQALLEKETGWKADSACKNPGRIMRLPLSKNVKRNVQTEILYLNTEALELFTLEKYAAFKTPVKKSATGKVVTELRIKLENLNGGSIRKLPNKKMLELLSGKDIVGGEVFTFRTRPSGGEYIDVNGTPADAWIDKDGFIGSGKDGGPTWVEWLKYYGKTEKDAYVFLYDQGITEVAEPEEEGYEVDRAVKIFTWGTPGLNRALSPITAEQSNLLSGEPSSGKTTFAFDIAWKNAKMGHRVLYLSLEMSRREIQSRLARSYAGITKAEWRDRLSISDVKRAAFKRRIDELKELTTLVLSGMPANTPPTIENIFKMIKGSGADIAFIDNFDLIEKRPGRTNYDEENRISAMMKDFPKKEQIPLIILHHKSKLKVSGLGGIRGSGKIVDDRYTALGCERDYVEDGTEEQNAKFCVVELKDRDFGHRKLNVVYFRKGSFYDTFDDPEVPKIPNWND